MKVSFDISTTLYGKALKNGMDNGRSLAAEIRFQLEQTYKKMDDVDHVLNLAKGKEKK